MNNGCVLLTDEQFNELAREFVEEIMKIPLYDNTAKQHIASKHLKKIQKIICDNIVEIGSDGFESVFGKIMLECLAR
jgi:hypothetical protein